MTEEDLEQACIGWFSELGWNHMHGEAVSPGGTHPEREHYGQVTLECRLRDALSRLNAKLPAEALDEAAKRLLQYAGQSLVEANREIYTWLRDGIPVEVEQDGDRRVRSARVFDFDDPDNNDWLIVNQFTVKGKMTCRSNLVAFVNGIPLGVIELKSPEDEDTDVTVAFHQIRNLKAEIRQLFEPNLCCVISNGTVARVGSITTDEERFMPWRDAGGIEHPKQHLELEVLVRGLFSRETLLDYLRYFVAFQNSGTGAVKLIAGYHQYHGVRKAAQRAVEAATRRKDGKGGVIWFTPGSGKSLLALFYVCLLRECPELENRTVVIVTEPNALDGQMFDTFAGCTVPLRAEPRKAETFGELKDMLRDQPAGGVFFTTIQKFRPDEPGKPRDVLCDRISVIVICDDTHDNQYGFKAGFDSKTGRRYSLAKHVREALPNAVYLCLTGTPIPEADKDTQAVFGEYVDIYDMLSSRRDGNTVPIHYESRIIDFAVNADEQEDLDEDLDKLLKSEDEAEKSRAVSRRGRLESVAMADDRLEKLACDLVTHWDRRLEVIDGKAMVVALARRAAVALYDEIIKLRPDWHNDELDKGVIKVVMSSTSSDPTDVRKHATTSGQKEQVKERLKDPADPLRLVIVRDMWLTGFDVPCLHTLYVDKPMRGAGLMQAMARVNRVWKDKPGGLVVDYIGLGEEVKAAIAQYTRVAGANRGRAVEFIEEGVKELKKTLDTVRKMFHGLDLASIGDPHVALGLLPQAMDHILKADPGDDPDQHEGVRRFTELTTRTSRAQALAGTHEAALSLREEIGFYQAVRVGLIKHTRSGRKMSKTAHEAAMRQIVAKDVLVEGVNDLYSTLGVDEPDISVMDERFLAEVARLPTKNLAAELLQRIIDDEIRLRSRKNTTQAQEFSKKLTEAINKYRNRGLTTAQVIEELIQLAREIGQDRPPEDMSEDEYAFYEALRENESAVRELGDPVLKSLAVELTHKLRASATIDWQKREGARARMRLLVKVLLTRYKYPPDKQPDAVIRVIEQAELYADQWGIEHP